jgi:transcriptional regulator with XRE-family HTH domain
MEILHIKGIARRLKLCYNCGKIETIISITKKEENYIMEKQEKMQTFAENIRKFRQQRGWSQETFAIEISKYGNKEYTFRSVSQWENGNCLPEVGTIIAISELIGVSLDELLKTEIEEFKKNHAAEPPVSERLAHLSPEESLFLYDLIQTQGLFYDEKISSYWCITNVYVVAADDNMSIPRVHLVFEYGVDIVGDKQRYYEKTIAKIISHDIFEKKDELYFINEWLEKDIFSSFMKQNIIQSFSADITTGCNEGSDCIPIGDQLICSEDNHRYIVSIYLALTKEEISQIYVIEARQRADKLFADVQ